MRAAAVACAVLMAVAYVSAASTVAATDRSGAGLLKRIRAMRTRRANSAARAGATYPTPTAATDLLGTDWSTVPFNAPVVIPAGKTLFHSSVQRIALGNYGSFHGFWMSPDVAQSVAGGVNKARGEFGGAVPVIVTAYTTQQPLTLLPLPSCARAGLAAVNGGGVGLTGTLMANPSNAVQPKLERPCAQWGRAGLHGWRSPWDQDEVMMCSLHQRTHLRIAYEYSCPLAVIGPNNGVEQAYAAQTRFPAEERLYPAATHCGAGRAPTAKDHLFSYEAKMRWAGNLGDVDPNTQPPTAASTLSAKLWDRVNRKVGAVPISGRFDRVQMARDYMNGHKNTLITPETLELFCDKL